MKYLTPPCNEAPKTTLRCNTYDHLLTKNPRHGVTVYIGTAAVKITNGNFTQTLQVELTIRTFVKIKLASMLIGNK